MTVFRSASVQKASTLAEHYYTSPEIFEQETQRIFHNHWICVGRGEQIVDVGDYFLAQIGAENLIILRDAQGCARAFFNVCRHRRTRLCQSPHGQLGEMICCTHHGWRYSLEGQLRSARRESVPAEESALFACALYEWEGFLWVNLAPNPVPFTQTVSPLLSQFAPWRLASLRVVEQITDEVQANWKLIFQAYCDRYLYTPTANRSPSLSAGAFLGASQAIDRDVLPLPGLRGEQGNRAYYYSLFPTMLLSLYPSHAIALRLYPQAADRTRIVCEWLSDRSAMSAVAMETWKRNHRQAWFGCEQMQRRHTARSMHANGLTAFDREYLRVLGASAFGLPQNYAWQQGH
ncbi:aromatic ring-hydroxylating dioxygenase subunit alpha [Microcoleus sp. FACHB-1515]|uniref:aromatic ring-hydroxylating oxygenase subunit alpha n=1 Tax=Cyanophyceae TaxID=3028117 RepID=UPI001683BFB1|nr:aromatic ring-hydroxylating dioxygenase subunit alpha [Microcoleus sp. FACHB-1515]MBD2089163.1 aromatic ring-hydroxylating dioxygenase subunit alpha [Microcoleus sp. FACHB-1515]